MIDFDKRIIKGKNRIYKIEPENLTVGRYNEFLLQGSLIAWQCDFNDLHKSWLEIYQILSNGNNILHAVTKGSEIAKRNYESISNFAQNTSPAIIRYCYLFCNYNGEDTSKYDPVEAIAKKDDWSHIPINDFFHLAAISTKYLPLNLRNINQNQKEENQTQNGI